MLKWQNHRYQYPNRRGLNDYSRGVYFANGVKNIGTPYANILNSITVAFNMQDCFIEQSIYNIAYLIRIVNPKI